MFRITNTKHRCNQSGNGFYIRVSHLSGYSNRSIEGFNETVKAIFTDSYNSKSPSCFILIEQTI